MVVLKVDLLAEGSLLIAELGGDGLSLRERFPDFALLLVVLALFAFEALPV